MCRSVGDAIDFFFCLMVIHTAQKIEGGLPANELSKMYTWAIADLGIGFVPIAGDIGDAIFKANTRNAIILEKYLRKKGEKNLKRAGRPVPNVDPSDPETFDHLQEEEAPPEYSSSQPGRGATHNNGHGAQDSGVTNAPPMPPRPAEARTHGDRRSGSFFGFGSRTKSRPVDAEMGLSGQGTSNRSARRG
jgi:hypothetical protein